MSSATLPSPRPHPREPHWGLRILGVLAAIIGLPLAMLAVAPGIAPSRWLSMQVLIAQGISFPFHVAAGAAVVALIVLGLYALIRRFLADGSSSALPFAAAVWAIAALGFGVMPAPPAFVAKHADTDGPTLTVVTYNSLDTFSAADLREIEENHHPDLIVLPEAAPKQVEHAVAQAGLSGEVITAPRSSFSTGYSTHIRPTTVIVSPSIGKVSAVPGPATTFGTVTLQPEDPQLPRIIAVHTFPPIPSGMDDWRDDVQRVMSYATEHQGPVMVVGDFNATLRHGPMANMAPLVDAARVCSRWPDGTWPVDAKYGMVTHIDHVLVPNTSTVTDCRTWQIGRGDHLAFAATVQFATDSAASDS